MALKAQKDFVAGVIGVDLEVILSRNQVSGPEDGVEDFTTGFRRGVEEGEDNLCFFSRLSQSRILHIMYNFMHGFRRTPGVYYPA
jgi:hypothetical protein